MASRLIDTRLGSQADDTICRHQNLGVRFIITPWGFVAINCVQKCGLMAENSLQGQLVHQAGEINTNPPIPWNPPHQTMLGMLPDRLMPSVDLDG